MLFENFVPDCVRSNLRGCKFKISWEGMPPDPPSSGVLTLGHTGARALATSGRAPPVQH